MRRVLTRFALLILVLSLAPALPGCGKRSGGPRITIGATKYFIPYLRDPLVQTQVLGLKNISNKDTTVDVTAFGKSGFSGGTFTVPVPAHNELRTPISAYVAGFGPADFPGWILIDTMGTPAEGFVRAYIDRVGTDNDGSEPGVAFRDSLVGVSLNGMVDAAQIVNHSFAAGGAPAIGVDWEVKIYDDLGGLFSTSAISVPAYGTAEIPITLGFVGMLTAEPVSLFGGYPVAAPAGTEFWGGVTALECGVQVLIEAPFFETEATRLGELGIGFDLGFGNELNATHDFNMTLSNTTTSTLSARIIDIVTDSGASLLAAPRLVTVGPHATKVLGTQTITSYGLAPGEQSPFDDIFGDVSLAPSLTRFFVHMAVPAAMFASARDFDSLFLDYYRIVRANQLTTNVKMGNIPIQITTAGAIRNYIDFMNPFSNQITVYIRAFTPGGTEYILDAFNIPAYSRSRWSPDGMIFREDPFDLDLPPVSFICFEISSSGGLYYNLRKTVRASDNTILVMRPGPWWNLAFE